MVHFGVLYIYGRRRGSPNVAGPGVANLPTPPSRRAWCCILYTLFMFYAVVVTKWESEFCHIVAKAKH